MLVGQSAADLQVLDLGDNRLSRIDVRSFRGLESLVHLDLSGNSIVDVVDGAFNGLRRLTRLDLRDNRVTRLTASTLRGLTSLRYLLLTNNRIQTIDRRAFRTLEGLVYIVLKGNPIGSQPVRFQVWSPLAVIVKIRGGFRHVQHVRPNRGPHKKGAPTRGPANFCYYEIFSKCRII